MAISRKMLSPTGEYGFDSVMEDGVSIPFGYYLNAQGRHLYSIGSNYSIALSDGVGTSDSFADTEGAVRTALDSVGITEIIVYSTHFKMN